MPKGAAPKHPRLYVDVSPDLHRRVKANAALKRMTVSEWVLGLILDELERDTDIRIALERLENPGSVVTLEQYQNSRSRR